MTSNNLCWNPMEANNFTVANEDHNLYTFDMRKLERALNVYTDFFFDRALLYVVSTRFHEKLSDVKGRCWINE